MIQLLFLEKMVIPDERGEEKRRDERHVYEEFWAEGNEN